MLSIFKCLQLDTFCLELRRNAAPNRLRTNKLWTQCTQILFVLLRIRRNATSERTVVK